MSTDDNQKFNPSLVEDISSGADTATLTIEDKLVSNLPGFSSTGCFVGMVPKSRLCVLLVQECSRILTLAQDPMSGQEPEEATMWTRKEINIFKETIRQEIFSREQFSKQKAFFEEKSVKHHYRGNDTHFLIVIHLW